MKSALGWRRQHIEAVRFSVDMLERAPVETWRRPDGGGIFQTIDGTDGTLFVNWGEQASATAFRQSFNDMLTRAIDISDTSVDVFGNRARRICATLEREATVASTMSSEGVVDHIETPAARYCTEVISFVRDGIPVLVGYRIAQSSRRDHDETIGRFLTSIRPTRSRTHHVANLAHLNARDTTLVFASRAPQKDIERLKQRMGWEMPWDTLTDDFDTDFGVNEWHGHNAFFHDGEKIYRTYFINARGDEALGTTWSYLDMTALGRQEKWEDSPPGYPQTEPHEWWIWHDQPKR